MNLKKSEIEIIKLLISSSHYISSYDIATATGINRRLVRDEMANVKTILKSLGYELISKPSNGYIIQQRSSESLNKLAAIIEDAERSRNSSFPTEPWERRNYIMKRLIDQNGYVKIDQLADELLISRSTVSNDIKVAKNQIKKYGLSFKQKPNYGICIVGEEIDKRKPICDYLFANLNESEMFYDYLNTFITLEDSLEYGIVQILKNNQIEMSDIALVDFLLSLSVNVSRIVVNQPLTHSPDISSIKDRYEMKVASEIANFIHERSDIEFNKHEVNQIAIQMICKRSSKGVEPNNSPYKLELIHHILDEIYNQTLIRFNKKEFLDIFSLYIDTYINCATFNEKIRHPLYDSLKHTYPLAYEIATITLTMLQEAGYKASSYDSSLAFFTTIFNTEINKNDLPKRKVLLISGLGGGSASLNKQIILERFENQIDITNSIQYYKLLDEDLSQYDFIISTIPIHRELEIPYVNISSVINNEDLDIIQSYLSYIFNKFQPEYYLHPKLFKSNIKAKNSKVIINEFYKLLKIHYPSVNESFKNNMIIKNQSTISTFKNKFAIIKLAKPLNNNCILPVLVLEEPILINSQKIQVIILFSANDSSNYIYNSLSNILTSINNNDEDLLEFLLKPTYTKLITLLKKNNQ